MTSDFERTPELFNQAQLFAKDFDGTVAQTFEPSPSGLGVNEAYEVAIETVFDLSTKNLFRSQGGLKNRAPSEVVHDLAPDASEQEVAELNTRLNQAKLDVLTGEIGALFPDGTVWPRPTRGYIELRQQMEAARDDGELIDDLILSSGHEAFIAKTYRAWNINQPTHLVATETIERLNLPYPPSQLVKPSPRLMDIARQMWRETYSVTEIVPTECARITYVGDDPIKDGELARSSGIEFFLLQVEASEAIWQQVAQRLLIGRTALKEAGADV